MTIICAAKAVMAIRWIKRHYHLNGGCKYNSTIDKYNSKYNDSYKNNCKYNSTTVKY